MPLFEYAITTKPEGQKEGQKEELIMAPNAIIAKDARTAERKAILDNAALIDDMDLDNIRILVRPFG